MQKTLTDKTCLADVHTDIFKTQVANGYFSQEQAVAKIRATTELLDEAAVRSRAIFYVQNPSSFSRFPAILWSSK